MNPKPQRGVLFPFRVSKVFISFFLVILLHACKEVPINPVNQGQPSRDNNLALGNPSNANDIDENNFLLIKPQYVVSYNRTRGSANWVSWHLSEAWKGDATRSDNFRPDESLPIGWYRVTTSLYTNTGFDRGHLCPSDDRDASAEDNKATFLLSNILPQSPNNNRVVWANLEEYCRQVMAAGNELYIMAGIDGIGGSGSNGGTTKTLDSKVTVPESLWKVIVIIPVGTNDIRRINDQTRTIAVIIPNRQSIGNKWGDYRISIDDLEDKTGYNFLSNVPQQIQNSIERRKDNGSIK
jgi:endonuclease G